MHDEVNHVAYSRSGSVDHYASVDRLQTPEAILLAEYAECLDGGRVLDLGIGGGRTTGHLAPRAATYVGIDYVAANVEAARRRHPGVDLRVGDARYLDAFADGSFDLVVFSFNGMDYVGHEDRLRILAGVHRVLDDKGVFLFSTHNREWDRFDRMPWQESGPVTRDRLRRGVDALRATARRREMRRHEVRAAEYAIVNDDAHQYSLLTYYIAEDAQRAQLSAVGFGDVLALSLSGEPTLGRDTTSAWLTYSARPRRGQ